jgi:glycerol-3-phosphate acyltransferase PlsX
MEQSPQTVSENNAPLSIAVDAMGGDTAPGAVVEGAVIAARENPGIEIILVGDQPVVEAELARHSASGLSISIQHAPQTVDMHDSPSLVVRRKRKSSVWIATELVKTGRAVSVISAGNTGASMATALFNLGPLKGVERPAIATPMPTLRGTSILIDAGANVDCKPLHLFQFALMGSEYCKWIFEKPNPTIGLLSIGEEEVKGNEVTKEALRILKASKLNFIGNVEGRDVFTGEADVVVCDGFIGNVALKISEGLADAIGRLLKREIASSFMGRLGYMILREPFQRFRRRVDYAEYGGAPLLGVNGISIICHGHSSPKAIKNAVRVARTLAENRVNARIASDIEESMATYKRAHEEFVRAQQAAAAAPADPGAAP